MTDFTESSPSPATTHPQWCHRPLCINSGTDTEHASAPAKPLVTDDQMWEASLIRRDGNQPHDVPEETRLRVDLTEMGLKDCNVQFVVSAENLPRLARFLMTRYEEYLFCSYPQDVRS